MERIPSITPGEILMEEFLIPMNISAYRLAKDTMFLLPESLNSQKEIEK